MELPADILKVISGYLAPADIRQLARTNRKLRQYLTSDHFWEELTSMIDPIWVDVKPANLFFQEWYEFLYYNNPLDDPLSSQLDLTIEQAYARKMNEEQVKVPTFILQDIHLALVNGLLNFPKEFRFFLERIDLENVAIVDDLINYFFWLDDSSAFQLMREMYPEMINDTIVLSHQLKDALGNPKEFEKIVQEHQLSAEYLYFPLEQFIGAMKDPFYRNLLQVDIEQDTFRFNLNILPVPIQTSLDVLLKGSYKQPFRAYSLFYDLYQELIENPTMRNDFLNQILQVGLSYGCLDIIIFALLMDEEAEVTEEFLAEFNEKGYIPPEVVDTAMIDLDLDYLRED